MSDQAKKHLETVYVIDDDSSVRDSLCWLLGSANLKSVAYGSAEAFLEYYDPGWHGCILMDVRMPGMNGLKLQEQLNSRFCPMPIVVLTGHANVTMAVTAMKNGAFDFIKKPYRDDLLLATVNQAMQHSLGQREESVLKRRFQSAFQNLTSREVEVMKLVVEGLQNKKIALELGISEKTVEIHRSRVMQKTEAKSVSELVRMSIVADR